MLRRWTIWLCLAAAVTTAAALGWVYWPRPAPRRDATDPFSVPAFSESLYLTTRPDARYVGAAVCKECHAGRHRSYLHTAHSRALSEADPNREPPDGSFEHQPSGRSYRVYRKDGQFRHEEVLRTQEGKEIGRIDLPIRYLVGSGAFSRTYAVENDGFLSESPITWYAQKKGWDTSPGYDGPVHPSFERPLGMECLYCHAGRVEPKDDTEKVAIAERAIGCESCHGPASHHVEYHRRSKHPAGTDDLTIVNPAKLSRPLLESVCAACHLQGEGRADVRGRRLQDYRPGLPLSDYRVHYAFALDNQQMSVVGHLEQMRNSACYKKTDDLSCLSCHDLHPREKSTDKVAFYRQKCLNCHESRAPGCSVPAAQRRQKEPADDCTACHVPRGKTDIPHIAFTHHRVSRPGALDLRSPDSVAVPDLVLMYDNPRLSATDRDRNLGLAYRSAISQAKKPERARAYHARARDLLEKVYKAGLRDGSTLEALARLYRKERNFPRARALAQEGLDATDVPVEARADLLLILAEGMLIDDQPEQAVALLEKVIRIRPNSANWHFLGLIHQKTGHPDRALPALQKAVALNPFDAKSHGALADVYRKLGDNRRAKEHAGKAEWLSANGKS
jgi:hypothetical protein